MAHNNDSVRNKLIEITNQGLMLKAIALNVGIDVNDLSRFKGGMSCLKHSDIEILSEYLNEVHIPQWNDNKKELISKKKLAVGNDARKESIKKPTKWEVLQKKMKN